MLAKAGLQVLQRPVPPGYIREWTEHFAKAPSGQQVSVSSAVPFRIASEWLALATQSLQEITEWRPIHSIPQAPPVVLGVVNIRGELLVCVSLGHLLGLADVPPRHLLRTHYGRLLVVQWSDRRIAFPVDEVQGPHRFFAENVQPAPSVRAQVQTAYAESVVEWQQRRLVLLDPDLLFSAVNRNLT